MLEILFAIGMLWLFGKLLIMGIKAAWGLSKILLIVVFFPIILIGMAIGGLLYLAVPILLIVGIGSLLLSKH